MNMLYVILVAAIIIFWLVAIDRPILVVSFKDGHLVRSKGHFPPTFKHNLIDIAQHEPFSGKLRCINKGRSQAGVFEASPEKDSSKESATYSHTKALHAKARH